VNEPVCAVVQVTPSVEVCSVKSRSAAKREAVVVLNALTAIAVTLPGLPSLIVTRWSGPAL
jgi:hypothetical protein